jgi:gluconokinase
MAAGHPLTDEDRAPWLVAIRDWIAAELTAGRSCVVTCSALKRSYRDVLRSATRGTDGTTRFAFLDVDRSLLLERLTARRGHYMHVNMLASQLETLEVPDSDERPIHVDEGAATTPDSATAEIIAGLGIA